MGVTSTRQITGNNQTKKALSFSWSVPILTFRIPHHDLPAGTSMKTLFVVPKFVRRESEYYELPLGITYVSTILKEPGYAVDVINMNLHPKEDEAAVITAYLKKHPVDVVLTGGLSAFFHSIKNILQSAKQSRPEITTVLGGGIVTSDKETICAAIKPDFAMLGEAEEATKEFIDALASGSDYTNIPNLAYQQDGAYIFNEKREAIGDLDALPYPDFSIFDIDDYFKRQTPLSQNYLYPLDFPRSLPIITSRSCPLSCTFCFHPIGQKYRMRSLDCVFAEIEQMIEQYDINMLTIMDEMMSASKRRLIEFSERIKPYNLLWTCQLWPSSVDGKTLKMMKEAGCYLISFGLESMNADVLQSMKKFGVTREKIEGALEEAKNHGITIQGNFIFGDPAETVESSNETLEWWKQHPEYQISLGRISPYPGTPLYENAIQQGLIKNRTDFIQSGSPALNLSKMSSDEYNELLSKIATYSSQARQYCKIITITEDQRTDYESYHCELQCPHCNEVISYGNLVVQRPEILKLGCRSCGLRFDLNPSIFPNLRELLERQREAIQEIHKQYGSIAISPAIFEDRFIEYFSLIGLDYHQLNIAALIDSNDTRIGRHYLNKYPILKRDQSTVDQVSDSAILIMLTLYKDEIIQQFHELGVPNRKIYSIEF